MAQAKTRPSLHGGLGGDEHDEAGRGTDDLVIALAELPQSESLLPNALEVVIIENWIEEVNARVPLLE
jgi:hypothetical protein